MVIGESWIIDFKCKSLSEWSKAEAKLWSRLTLDFNIV